MIVHKSQSSGLLRWQKLLESRLSGLKKNLKLAQLKKGNLKNCNAFIQILTEDVERGSKDRGWLGNEPA